KRRRLGPARSRGWRARGIRARCAHQAAEGDRGLARIGGVSRPNLARRAAAEGLAAGEWHDFWIYVAGPFAGASLGALAYAERARLINALADLERRRTVAAIR